MTMLRLISGASTILAVVSGFSLQHSSSHRSFATPTVRHAVVERVEKTKEEWKQLLTDDQYYVLREEGTEPANTSPLNSLDPVADPGTFTCAGCGSPLFVTETKYESGTGWPSFYAPIDNEAVAFSTDFKLIVPRTECRCGACDGHLGHVFDDGPDPTGQRFCLNGVAMDFVPDEVASPELLKQVRDRQSVMGSADAGGAVSNYKPSINQVLPGTIFNVLLGGLFFNSLIMNLEQGAISPILIFPLGGSLYYGFQAAKGFGRLIS